MSRNRQEQAGASLQAEETALEQVETDSQEAATETASPETASPEAVSSEAAAEPARENEAQPDAPLDAATGAEGQSQGGEKKAEQDVHQKMTADQYIRRVYLDAGIGELVWRLYRTKIMSFEEWEDTVKTLLKKKVR
jgi:hypothetical protein